MGGAPCVSLQKKTDQVFPPADPTDGLLSSTGANVRIQEILLCQKTSSSKNFSAILASCSPVSNRILELEQRKELNERKSLFGRGESLRPGVTEDYVK